MKIMQVSQKLIFAVTNCCVNYMCHDMPFSQWNLGYMQNVLNQVDTVVLMYIRHSLLEKDQCGCSKIKTCKASFWSPEWTKKKPVC